MTQNNQSKRLQEIEAETRRKFSNGEVYQADTITVQRNHNARDYFGRLNNFKLSLVEQHAPGRRVLDICTAAGEHLFEMNDAVGDAVGVDFSLPFLSHGLRHAQETNEKRFQFVCGNARNLPFPDASFGVVFSFSSLYAIPRVVDALSEMQRVLEPDGVAIFDLGNTHSINDRVSRAHTETAEPCFMPISQMLTDIAKAGFEIDQHYRFQLLPYWGEKPGYLHPLLLPIWKRIMETNIAGKMLDERLCALPLLRRFAFRHIFLCRKGTAK